MVESRPDTGTHVSDPLLPAIRLLRVAGDPSPRRTAATLASHVTGQDENACLIGRCPPLSAEQTAQLTDLCRRRSAGEPLQYLTGTAWFMGDAYAVGPGVLVPRPDSEILVLEALKRRGEADPAAVSPLRFADLCTGTGCVGLSFARELDKTGISYEGLLTDLSDEALHYATVNLHALAPRGPIRIVQADLLPDSGDRFDLILSNPPYIPSADIAGLMPEVSIHEPRSALDGGADGLVFYRRLTSIAPARLAEGGWLLVEHGFDQGEAVRELFRNTACFDTVESVRDLGGHERVTAARRGYDAVDTPDPVRD